jgi:hypothetical protein
MADFMADNERVYGSFMSFAQSVSLDIMPDGDAVDREIGMFKLQLGRFPEYTPDRVKLPSDVLAPLRISSFIDQLNQVKIKIQNMRESSIALIELDILNFKTFLLELGRFFRELQEHLKVYFQYAASAKGGGEKSHKENLKDLLRRMTTIVDKLPS